MIITLGHSKSKRLFIEALIARIVMLAIIVLLSANMAKGFIGNNTYYDDYRYEMGGEYYSKNAKALIDVPVFVEAYASVGDWVGYHFLENPLDASPLWYWIVCFLMYLFKSYVAVRIFNVIVSAIAVVYVYKFAKEAYCEKQASKAAKLLAFLPYPVIFSCFGYKDQLIMLLTFYLLYQAVYYKNNHSISSKRMIVMLIAGIALLFVRGGLSAILIILCLIIAFEDVLRGRLNSRTLVLALVGLLIVLALVIRSYGTVLYKLQYYLQRHSDTLANTNISFITINSIKEIYKLPFTYIFSIVMPIGLNSNWDSWYGIVAHINVIMTPVAVGATLYAFKKKTNAIVYWGCLAYYLISIVTSINIFRHYYSLIPFSLIAFSGYMKKGNVAQKGIVYGIGLIFATLLIVFYLI